MRGSYTITTKPKLSVVDFNYIKRFLYRLSFRKEWEPLVSTDARRPSPTISNKLLFFKLQLNVHF